MISGKISCRILSKGIRYSVYIVFKLTSCQICRFTHKALKAKVEFVGEETTEKFVFLEPNRKKYKSWKDPMERGDGWTEVELGKFYNNGDFDENEIKLTLMVITPLKGDFVIQGIEIRPFKEEEEEEEEEEEISYFGYHLLPPNQALRVTSPPPSNHANSPWLANSSWLADSP